jgi:hypothetical protein
VSKLKGAMKVRIHLKPARDLQGGPVAVYELLSEQEPGFDLGDAPEAACRGRFVGLVNHRIKKQILTQN